MGATGVDDSIPGAYILSKWLRFPAEGQFGVDRIACLP